MMRPHLLARSSTAAPAWSCEEDDRLIAMIASHFSGGKFLHRRYMLDARIVDEHVERGRSLQASFRSFREWTSGFDMSAPEWNRPRTQDRRSWLGVGDALRACRSR